jgi:iron complex outermembrane recepter protein
VKIGTNVPLGERAAGRFAVWHNRLAGYMDAVQPDLTVNENVNTGTRTGLRAAVRLAPTPAVSIVPRLVFQSVRMDGWNRIDTFNILANPYTGSRPRVTLGERRHFTQIPEPFTDDFVLGDVNFRYDAGGMSFTSISSWTHRDILVVRDATALTASITGGNIGLPERVYTLNAPLDDATEVNVLSQEFRLSGGTPALRWLVGAFASKSKRDYGQSLIVSGFEAGTSIPTRGLRAERDELFYSDLSYDLKQGALFGEATVTLLERLDLTGGIRYYGFDEERSQIFDGIFAHDSTGRTVVSVPGKTSASGIAPRVIASLRATPNFTLNAQASQGIRLGGINDPLNLPLCTPQDRATFGGRTSWTDETAWNYEVGAKSQWMNGRVSLNASAFYMDIRDLQLVVTAGSCSSRLVFNVPKAFSSGLELELAAAPSPMFDFAASGTFNNSELKSTVTSTSSAGVVSVVSGIQSGNRLPSVPEFQGSAAATIRRPMQAGGQGFFTATYQYVGARITQIDDHEGRNAAGLKTVDLNSFGANTIGRPLSQGTFTFNPELPAYQLVNLRAGLVRGTWELALFLNNVLDERALLALDRERGLRARVGYLTNQPRTLGLTLGFNY